MKITKIVAALAFMGSLGFALNAQAAGTLAGTSITNTANLAFAIGGVAQTPKASNTVSFLVDNKVNLLVTEENGAPTPVTPGGTNFVTRFKVTNLGNSPQDYGLYLIEGFTLGQTLFGKNNNFLLTNGSCTAVVDSATGTANQYDANDTAQHIANLDPDASKYVFVRCPIPASRVNNDYAFVSLYARTHNANTGFGSAPTAATNGSNTAGVDVVFADVAGSEDINRDGVHSARSAYLVQAPTLAVVKTVTPLCDPYNFNTNPKNIPGAYVRYSIAVTNGASAGSSAILNNITDTLAIAGLTFDPNLIAPTASSCDTNTPPESATGVAFKVSCSGGTRACTTTPMYKTVAAGDDGFQFVSPNITAGLGVALPAETDYLQGELKAGETVRVEFNALVK